MRELVDYYIGGGWGKEDTDKQHLEPAFVIRGTDIPSVGVGDVSGVPHRFHKTSNLRSRRLQPGDLVFETSGGSKDQPVGRALLVTERVLGSLGGDVMCASFCKLVRPNQERVVPRFLLGHLQALYEDRRITEFQTQSTGILNFRFEEFLDAHEVPLPPVLLQRKIAAVLAAYDGLIENNLRRINILEETADAVYREWFLAFHHPGHDKQAMVDSPLGPIPKGWEARPLGESIEVLGGATPSTKRPEFWEDGEINWFTPSDLTGHGHMLIEQSNRKITRVGLEGCSAKLFPEGSVMMTSRATLGVLAINTQEACTNQGFITCLPNDEVPAAYIYFWLKEQGGLIKSAASGATFKEISKRVFREIMMLIPDRKVLRGFDELVKPLLGMIRNLIAQNANLRATRDLLLPRLVSGEIDVSDLDIDTEWLVA